jgi:gluconolactonase
MTTRRSQCLLNAGLMLALLAGLLAVRAYQSRSQKPVDRSVQGRWKSLTTHPERFREQEAWVRKGSAIVPELIEALSSDDWWLRWNIVNALARIGKPARSAIPALILALGDSEYPVHDEAARALNCIGCDDPAVLPDLVRCLGSDRVSNELLTLVSSFGTHAIPAAVELTQSENAGLRRRGVDLLRRIGVRTKEVVSALRELRTQDALREQALDALFVLRASGPDDVSLMLTEESRRESTLVGSGKMTVVLDARFQAVFRLVEPGDLFSVVQQRLAERHDDWVRILRGLAEAEIVAPEWSALVPLLMPLVQDEDRSIRYAALQALRRLQVDRQSVVPLLRELVLRGGTDGNHDFKEAARLLARLAPDIAPEIVSLLRERLRGSDTKSQASAIELLGALGEATKDALPDLKEAIRHPELRRSAIETLSQLGRTAEPLIPDLLKLCFGESVSQPSAALRHRACMALAQIAPNLPEVQTGLLSLLDTPADHPPFEVALALAEATTLSDITIRRIDDLKATLADSSTQPGVATALAEIELRARLQSTGVKRFVSAPAFSEGPAWFDGELRFCSDGLRRANRIGETSLILDLAPAGLFQRPDGNLLVCDNRTKSLLVLAPDGRVGVLADAWNGVPLRSLNDVTQDADGNIFWTDSEGSSIEHPVGRVFRLRPDGKVECLANDLAFPNGIEVDPRNQFLYVVESQTHRVLRSELESFEYAPHPVPRRFYPVFDLGGSGGDGCAFDAAGRLWVADFHRQQTHRGRITVIESEGYWPYWRDQKWKFKAHIDVPAEAVSNLTFGGADYDELFCTTGNPHGVFHAKTGMAGFRGHAGKSLKVLRHLKCEPSTE